MTTFRFLQVLYIFISFHFKGTSFNFKLVILAIICSKCILELGSKQKLFLPTHLKAETNSASAPFLLLVYAQ